MFQFQEETRTVKIVDGSGRSTATKSCSVSEVSGERFYMFYTKFASSVCSDTRNLLLWLAVDRFYIIYTSL